MKELWETKLKWIVLALLGLFLLWEVGFMFALNREIKSYGAKSDASLVRYKKKISESTKEKAPKDYKLTPPDKTHTILIATNAQGSEWLTNNRYNWSGTPNSTSITDLYLENNTSLPGMNSVNGTMKHIYFWATPRQTSILGAVRISNQVIFYKADNGYLNSLRNK